MDGLRGAGERGSGQDALFHPPPLRRTPCGRTMAAAEERGAGAGAAGDSPANTIKVICLGDTAVGKSK